jgi:hypothetical protein
MHPNLTNSALKLIIDLHQSQTLEDSLLISKPKLIGLSQFLLASLRMFVLPYYVLVSQFLLHWRDSSNLTKNAQSLVSVDLVTWQSCSLQNWDLKQQQFPQAKIRDKKPLTMVPLISLTLPIKKLLRRVRVDSIYYWWQLMLVLQNNYKNTLVCWNQMENWFSLDSLTELVI